MLKKWWKKNETFKWSGGYGIVIGQPVNEALMINHPNAIHGHEFFTGVVPDDAEEMHWLEMPKEVSPIIRAVKIAVEVFHN